MKIKTLLHIGFLLEGLHRPVSHNHSTNHVFFQTDGAQALEATVIMDDSFEPWSSKKASILSKYTTSEKLSITTVSINFQVPLTYTEISRCQPKAVPQSKNAVCACQITCDLLSFALDVS